MEVSFAQGDILHLKNGKKILDGIASWWTCIHGHRHPKILEAIQKQIQKLDHVMLAGFTHEPAELLAEKLYSISNGDFPWVFYSDNGSNAVEIGLKIAHQYFKNTNPNTTKNTFVRFTKSYHGDSIGAMSVSGQSPFTRIFRELTFPTMEYTSPNCVRCPFGKKVESCNTECLQAFREDAVQYEDRITGVILEPLVSGANGMVFHSEKFLQELQKITRKHGFILLLDEVFTGLYRTGYWFAYQRAEIQPDIIAISKGLTGGTLPLGCTLVSQKIHEAFEDPLPDKAFFHGHTMTGNPIACSAALASLELLEESGKEWIPMLENRMRERGNPLQKSYQDLVRDMRVLGAVLAFEVNTDLGPDEYLNPVGRRLRKVFLEEGALVRPLGNTVYLTPPYNISESHLDQLFEILQKGLDSLRK